MSEREKYNDLGEVMQTLIDGHVVNTYDGYIYLDNGDIFDQDGDPCSLYSNLDYFKHSKPRKYAFFGLNINEKYQSVHCFKEGNEIRQISVSFHDTCEDGHHYLVELRGHVKFIRKFDE